MRTYKKVSVIDMSHIPGNILVPSLSVMGFELIITDQDVGFVWFGYHSFTLKPLILKENIISRLLR